MISEQVERVAEALERHGSFAVTMLRALFVGIECNKGVSGWSKDASDHAEKVFAEALAEDRARLIEAIGALPVEEEGCATPPA